jgi:hypothetical protein
VLDPPNRFNPASRPCLSGSLAVNKPFGTP